YTALDETKSQIRVLKLYRAKNFGDPLVLDVQIQNLDDDMLSNPFSRYTALSYCWGPPIMDASIILAGHHFPITKSLESALRHLRNKGDYELWWIDQISINQADIDERGSQVSLMRQIYKRAGSVQVWLGDEADDSSTAFDVLNR
ncbi:HET-domain-containing protein, partial [Trematosphaeria pertusa]